MAKAPVPYIRVDAPNLAINGGKIPHNTRLVEQRIAANLFACMAANGWTVKAVDDFDQVESMSSPDQAMELIFDLDMSKVHFTDGTETHQVLLVCGNGVDLIADYSYQKDDADGFEAVMDSFNADEFDL